MRMVKREECSYEEFYQMRLQVLRQTPYGLLNTEYLKEDKVAFFYFWDSDYIPKDWEQWVIRPVSKNSKEAGVSEEHRK